MAITEKRPITTEEFLQMDLGEGNFELVRGEVIELPPALPEHGRYCLNAAFQLETFGRQAGHGYAVTNDSAVQTERGPDTVRGGDVCYYSHARWPRSELRGLPPVAPDVVVEVYSPSNRPGEMRAKVNEYLEVGTLMVWVVFPERRTVVVYRPADPVPRVFGQDDVLEGFPELPGFRCPVAALFE